VGEADLGAVDRAVAGGLDDGEDVGIFGVEDDVVQGFLRMLLVWYLGAL
jgi:hypothetical protein